jgi:hypothetical protein
LKNLNKNFLDFLDFAVKKFFGIDAPPRTTPGTPRKKSADIA